MQTSEMSSPVPNYFNRSGCFYPLVTNYVVLMHGFLELASRNVVRLARGSVEASSPTGGGDPGRPFLFSPGRDVSEEELNDFYRDPARREVTRLIAPLSLRSEMQGNSIDIDADDLAEEIFDNHYYLLPWMMRAGGGLLISAWEMTKASSDQGPTWEFLRHCRNASAHGGRFNFMKDEPRRPAAWGPFTIERSMQGTPLFKGYNGEGLLSPGDPIRLLWDIEQANPNLEPDLLDYT